MISRVVYMATIGLSGQALRRQTGLLTSPSDLGTHVMHEMWQDRFGRLKFPAILKI